MQNNRNLKDLFPLPLQDTSYFDLSQGEIFIDLRRDIFIWGIVFQKATFKEATKLQIQIRFSSRGGLKGGCDVNIVGKLH